MKLLWVKTDFLHPTTRGGQIRTLEMLRELHRHHEVHYVAFDDGATFGVIERPARPATRGIAWPVLGDARGDQVHQLGHVQEGGLSVCEWPASVSL